MRRLKRRLGGGAPLRGPYTSWQKARAEAGGYDSEAILRRVVTATREVVHGRAAFERDAVVVLHEDHHFPLLAALLKVAARRQGRLHVLDFGGALGSTYYQCRPFLLGLPRLRWSVVEQAHFVQAGRAEFETDTLTFHESIDECSGAFAVDAVLLSGVLQYLEDPYALLRRVVGLEPSTLVIDRTPVVEGPSDVFAVQVVPTEIYPASYAFRAFGEAALENVLAAGYRVLARFSTVDPDMNLGATRVRFRGWIFEQSI